MIRRTFLIVVTRIVSVVMHNHGTEKGLLYAFLINTSFVVVEALVVIYFNSLTVFADLLHMVTDSASILFALAVAYLAKKGTDSMRTYGYERLEVLSGLANAVFLVGVVGYIVFHSIQRLSSTPEIINSNVLIVVGIVGVGVNLLAAYFLHSSRDNINVEGAFLHLVADAIGSIATLLAGIIIYFTGMYIFDVIFALIISGIILYSIKDLLYESINILLLGRPVELDIKTIEETLEGLDNVVEAHHTHIWSVSSSKTMMSTHLVINDEKHLSRVLDDAHELLDTEFDIHHSTIQVETEDFLDVQQHEYRE